jgi:ketol-acid reductoisomerase
VDLGALTKSGMAIEFAVVAIVSNLTANSKSYASAFADGFGGKKMGQIF